MVRRRKPFHPAQILPSYGTTQTDTINMVSESVFLHFGITDIASYFRKMRYLIAISVIVCAIYGASIDGPKGFAIGALCGLAAPAAVVWLGVMLVYVVIYLAVWFAAMAVVLYALWWFISGLFGG